MGSSANSEDPDEMQHYAGPALFVKIKTTFRDRNAP